MYASVKTNSSSSQFFCKPRNSYCFTPALPAMKTEWSSSAVLMHQYVSTQLAAGLLHSVHFLLCEDFFF